MGAFVIVKTKDNRFGYNLLTDIGDKILSKDGYLDKERCLHAIKQVKQISNNDFSYEKALTEQHEFCLLLLSPCGESLGESETFREFSKMDKALVEIKKHAPWSDIVDE